MIEYGEIVYGRLFVSLPPLLTPHSGPLVSPLGPGPHITILSSLPAPRRETSHAGYNKTVSIATMSHCHRHGGILIICVFQNRTSNFKENILRRVYPLIQNFASIIFRSFLSEVARLIGSKWFKLLLYLQTCAGIL